MTKRLMADGVTGKVAIMRQGSRDVFENPKSNLDKICFHSDLDYMGIVQQIMVDSIAFPAHAGIVRKVENKSKSGGGLFKGSKTTTSYYPISQSGVNYYYLGAIVGDVDGPMLGFKDGATPLTMIPVFNTSYTEHGNVLYAWRNVSIGIQNNQIVMKEAWYSLGANIPEQSIDNIKIVKFNMMTGANLPASQTLLISPTRFIASKGKLDSQNRYVKRSATGPYWLYYGRTMNSENGGGRWVYPVTSGANIGQNLYLEENGYQSNTPFVAPNPTGLSI